MKPARLWKIFVDTVHTLKFSFLFILTIFPIQIVVFSSREWVSTEGDGEVVGKEGLWEHCREKGIYTCCKPLETYLETANLTEIPDWLILSRRYQITGFVSGFVSCVVTVLSTLLKQSAWTLIFITTATLLNFATGGILAYSVNVYGNGFTSGQWLENPSLRWSFVVAGSIAGFYFLNGVVMTISLCRIKTSDDFPPEWEPMANGQDIKPVFLHDHTTEFTKVEDAFRNSIGKEVEIKSIIRIQSKTLYKQYIGKRTKLMTEIQDLNDDEIEKTLWHGTLNDIVDSIIHEGFDRSYCGRNATTYGQGSYFARNASYSTNYTNEDNQGVRQMFLCKVLVGRVALGDSTMRRPPKKGSIVFHSTVDNEGDPRIYVVYKDANAYPEYLIAYKHK